MKDLSRINQELLKENAFLTQRITELEASESKLKQVDEVPWKSEEKFRTIFDRASDGILIADAITKKCLQGNTVICSMLGYTKEEIESLTIYDIHPPKDISLVLDEIEKQAKGEITLAEGLPVLRKDGSIFYADISASPVIIVGVQCLLGIFRDITERKHLEEALRESEGKHRNVVENAIEAIFVLQEGLVKFVNPASTKLMGYGSADTLETSR